MQPILPKNQMTEEDIQNPWVEIRLRSYIANWKVLGRIKVFFFQPAVFKVVRSNMQKHMELR